MTLSHDDTVELATRLAKDNPSLTLEQAAKLLGLKQKRLAHILYSKGKSWTKLKARANADKNHYGIGEPITVPSELVMRLRSYKHTRIEYKNGIAA